MMTKPAHGYLQFLLACGCQARTRVDFLHSSQPRDRKTVCSRVYDNKVVSTHSTYSGASARQYWEIITVANCSLHSPSTTPYNPLTPVKDALSTVELTHSQALELVRIIGERVRGGMI